LQSWDIDVAPWDLVVDGPVRRPSPGPGRVPGLVVALLG